MTQPDPSAQGATGATGAGAATGATGATPPWGSDADFDPAKAWKLIEGLRADKDALAKRPVLTDEAQASLAEFEKLKKANQTDLEKANESLTRFQTEAEQWRTRAVASKVEALAAADFADPTDAVNGLDPSKYLGAGGEIDDGAIKKDLAALLEAKPHYRRPEGQSGPRVPAPNAAQGTSGTRTATEPRDQFAAVFGQALK